MTCNEPKSKQNYKLKPPQPLPLITNGSRKMHHFKGEFNGLCVIVNDKEDMKRLVSMGCFGKATLSRTYPEFQKHCPDIVRNRVFQNRKSNCDNDTKKISKVVLVPDSESECEDILEYFTNLKPDYQLDLSGIVETVNLSLEEAFFLAASINYLDISYKGKFLDLAQVWELFKQSNKHFVTDYIVYYYFRSKNWIVKTGIKFGGDFLLYKQGPAFFHASYVVIIYTIDESLRRIEHLNKRSGKYSHLMGLNRLCETAGKELLICEVIWPSKLNYDQTGFEDLSHFTIKETIMKRWISSKERQSYNDD